MRRITLTKIEEKRDPVDCECLACRRARLYEKVRREMEARRVKVVGEDSDAMAKGTRAALKALGSQEKVEQITDLERIQALGLECLPALLVDGTVLTAGEVPEQSRLESLLKQAIEKK